MMSPYDDSQHTSSSHLNQLIQMISFTWFLMWSQVFYQQEIILPKAKMADNIFRKSEQKPNIRKELVA